MRNSNVGRSSGLREEQVMPSSQAVNGRLQNQGALQSPSEDLLDRWLESPKAGMKPLGTPRLQMSGLHYGKAPIFLAGLTPEDQEAAKAAEKKERIEKAAKEVKEEVKEAIIDAVIGIVEPYHAVDAVRETKQIVDKLDKAAKGK